MSAHYRLIFGWSLKFDSFSSFSFGAKVDHHYKHANVAPVASVAQTRML